MRGLQEGRGGLTNGIVTDSDEGFVFVVQIEPPRLAWGVCFASVAIVNVELTGFSPWFPFEGIPQDTNPIRC